jgi:hypothetical protein
VRFWLAVAALAPIILPERADSADAKVLIAELEQELDPRCPRASRHGYSVEKLLREAVAFFVTRHGGMPAGCGGFSSLAPITEKSNACTCGPDFAARAWVGSC